MACRIAGRCGVAQTQLETAAWSWRPGSRRAQFEHAVAVLTGKPPSDLSIPAARTRLRAGISIGIPSTLWSEGRYSAPNGSGGRQRTDRNRQSCALPVVPSAPRGFANHSHRDFTHVPTLLVRGTSVAETLFDAGKRRAQVKVTQAAMTPPCQYRQTY